jgi:8-oxo-dGTP pyrophosphatase MutT (NUDIX family)
MIIGVGLLLFAEIEKIPKIFVIQELKDKPEIAKEKGMFSFPLETYKKSDGDYLKTLERLLKEEVGISLSNVAICEVFEKRFRLIPGREDVETVYGYGIFIGNPLCNFTPSDNDIKFEGWMSFKEILARRVRVEVMPILQHFLSQKTIINP